MTDSNTGIDQPHDGLISRLGIVIVSVTADRATATMPVEGNTQPYGYLHGGASAALAETLGSLAAMAHAGVGKIAVGVDLNITHHRAISEGIVTATATAAHLGRNVASYNIEVVSPGDLRVATARLTCFIRDTPLT